MVVGSDAHSRGSFAARLDEAYRHLSAAGFDALTFRRGGERVPDRGARAAPRSVPLTLAHLTGGSNLVTQWTTKRSIGSSRRPRRGNSEAFGAIFDAYAGPIYRFIASRVNRPSDAEDLTQLVFVKALEALPRYEARGIPFGGWLFRLARNAIIDQVRTRNETTSRS